jgi:hypothetical protein
MKENSKSEAALLWDESFLWGLMAQKALESNGLPFELVRALDIQEKGLGKYKLLFVPGGWASQKLKALGNKGIDEIKKFVEGGGSYLGICGGAGLATKDGMALLDIARRPTRERVPSFNGRIQLNTVEHPVWENLDRTDTLPVFHAWWPSQFVIKGPAIKVLARYGNPMPDSFSSDLNVGDTNRAGCWPELEDRYGINLDPARLRDEPAVVEGNFGKGRVVLSLIHFDTPDDPKGSLVLKSLWQYLGVNKTAPVNPERHPPCPALDQGLEKQAGQLPELISGMETAVTSLIDLGLRNFLWFRRDSMLLQWRRGVRGMEYCTLYHMVKELCRRLREDSRARGPQTEKSLLEIKELLAPFVEKAKDLLLLERYAMQNGQITYEKCDVPEIRKIRLKLFSDSKSYGGLFKNLIDRIDALLYSLLIEQQKGC